MNSLLSTTVSIFSLAVGAIVLWFATDGGQAWTAESARRLAVTESPLPLPDIAIDATGASISLVGDKASDSPLILLELVYTRCPTVCQLMGAEFAALQARLKVLKELPNVRLVSLSFDPEDDLSTMADYGKRYRADDRWWALGIPRDFSELKSLQQLLGSIVIPEPTVGFIHNTAVYVIYRGALVAILDHDDHEGIDRLIEKYGHTQEVFSS